MKNLFIKFQIHFSILLVTILLFSSCFESVIRPEFSVPKNSMKNYYESGTKSDEFNNFFFQYCDTKFKFYLPKKLQEYNTTYYSEFDPSDYPKMNILEQGYTHLLLDQSDKVLINDLIWSLGDLSEQSGFDIIQLMVAFVQSIPYDYAGGQVKNPLQTLSKGRGDCDDKSLLLAKLLGMAGFKSCLLAFPQNKHMALGLKIVESQYAYKDGFVFIETTDNFNIGQIPKDFNKDLSEPPIIIELDIFGPQVEVSNYPELLTYYQNKK
jgi:hypothetical protein